MFRYFGTVGEKRQIVMYRLAVEIYTGHETAFFFIGSQVSHLGVNFMKILTYRCWSFVGATEDFRFWQGKFFLS